MRNVIIGTMALIVTTAVPYAPRSAGAAGEGSASVGVYSNYVWRGQTLSDEVVVQPTVGISYGGIGINLWANYDADTEELNETDLTLSFANSLDKFSYEAGYIYYGLGLPGSSVIDSVSPGLRGFLIGFAWGFLPPLVMLPLLRRTGTHESEKGS